MVRERGHLVATNVLVNGNMWFNARSPIVEVGSSRVRIQAQSGVFAVGPAELAEAGSVDTIGWTSDHPSNHWGTPAMLAGLTALADAFYTFTVTTNLVLAEMYALLRRRQGSRAAIGFRDGVRQDPLHEVVWVTREARTASDRPLAAPVRRSPA